MSDKQTLGRILAFIFAFVSLILARVPPNKEFYFFTSFITFLCLILILFNLWNEKKKLNFYLCLLILIPIYFRAVFIYYDVIDSEERVVSDIASAVLLGLQVFDFSNVKIVSFSFSNNMQNLLSKDNIRFGAKVAVAIYIGYVLADAGQRIAYSLSYIGDAIRIHAGDDPGRPIEYEAP